MFWVKTKSSEFAFPSSTFQLYCLFAFFEFIKGEREHPNNVNV